MNRDKLLEQNEKLKAKVEKLTTEPSKLQNTIKKQELEIIEYQRVLFAIVHLRDKILPSRRMRAKAREALGL